MWTKQDINNKDYFNVSRMNSTARLHQNYVDDSAIEQRLKEYKCKVCFYNTSVCGQAFTEYKCRNCNETHQHSNTCVPTLCLTCSIGLNLCSKCGGNL